MPTISPLSGMAEPPVSVMFAVTSSWLIPLAVAIRSLCVHSDPRRNYELYIVHHGLEEEQMKELGKAVSGYPRVSLGFCRLPERLLRILQHRDCGRFSPLTYGRLLAAALSPRHDRVVYLDVDVLLNGDVAELYDADLHGAPIGAVRDCAVLQSISTGRLPDHLEYISGMGVTNPRLYCNTGVMVMDLVQMREQETEDRLLRLLEAHPDSFPYVDQDIINIVFHGRIAPLPLRWNYHFQFELHHAGMADLISGTEFEEAPALFESRSWKLFHLVGDYKPWLPPDMEKIYHRLYLALWWPLARQTPAFRRELRALYRQFTHAFRSRLRHHQWSLPVSPGRNFRKRREKIKTLQRQLAVFDGSWP